MPNSTLSIMLTHNRSCLTLRRWTSQTQGLFEFERLAGVCAKRLAKGVDLYLHLCAGVGYTMLQYSHMSCKVHPCARIDNGVGRRNRSLREQLIQVHLGSESLSETDQMQHGTSKYTVDRKTNTSEHEL